MRLTIEQKEQILQLLEAGLLRNEIAKLLNINWRQVDYWAMNKARVSQLVEEGDLKSLSCRFESDLGYQYAYILGCYLGDGYLNKQGKYTWKIRISSDVKYPNIIKEQTQSLDKLFGGAFTNQIGNCVTVMCYDKNLPIYFPQHGTGRKHDRVIQLESWQQSIVDRHPAAFLKGLYHSDGSRYIHRHREYERSMYNFTNRSKDIIDLFCSVCNILDVRYVKRVRDCKGRDGRITGRIWTVTIHRKDEVAKCDKFLGPKT